MANNMNAMQDVNLVRLDLLPDINGDIAIKDYDGVTIVKIPKGNTDEETIKKAKLIYEVYFKDDFFIYNDGSELSKFFNSSIKMEKL